MIPVDIDVERIVAELNSFGWKDQKIEIICDFSPGYIAKLRSGPRPNRPYQLVARLFNFWEDEASRFANRQTLSETTT